MTTPLPCRENRTHGTDAFPCAFYRANSRYMPSLFSVKHHWHEETELLHFEKGHYHLEVNMDKYEITEECFCFLNSGELHALSCEENYRETALVFSPRILKFACSDPAQKQFIQPLTEGLLSLPRFVFPDDASFPVLKEYYRQIDALFADERYVSLDRDQTFTDHPVCQLRIKSCLLQILAALAENGALLPAQDNTDSRIEMIKHVIGYMKEHSTEKICLHDLADLAGMNEQYFCRLFKKIIGTSPNAFLNDLRLKHAARLLVDTSLSVTEVSLEAGFNNLGNFMRLFKNAYGQTPFQYKKAQLTYVASARRAELKKSK